MKRRWIIRTFFIGPLLLFVVGWGWSAGHSGWVLYKCDSGYTMCATSRGDISFSIDWTGSLYVENGWQSGSKNRHDGLRFFPDPHNKSGTLFLGFSFDRFLGAYSFGVPYWFLVVVATTILIFVWRKTRPKAKGRPFPVEASKPSEKP